MVPVAVLGRSLHLMPEQGHVTDPLVRHLTDVYTAGQNRLQQLVNDGLRRGLDADSLNGRQDVRGAATHAYRERQLQQARIVLAHLREHTERYVPIVTGRAYRAGAFAVDRTVTDAARLIGTFGGIHVGALEVIATNLTDRVTDSLTRVGNNIESVFDRASALERGELPAEFIGRRVADPYRDAALREVGTGLVAGDTRRQVSESLMRRLVTEGTTDALTGFVTRTGARLPLDVYTSMVARTTTREAVTVATGNRLQEAGLDLVTISSHAHKSDECTPYDGKTFSLSGTHPTYPLLDRRPPFHGNCLHVMTPASVDLDEWEAELADLIHNPAGSVTQR